MPLQLYLDESIRGSAITVGGFFMESEHASAVVAGFHDVKQRLGLDPYDELKHTLGRKHPTRKKFDDLGYARSQYVPFILDWIATQPIRVIANTNFPERTDIKPEQLYCDALGYCMLRFANVIQFGGHHLLGPHGVTVDTPPDQRKLPPTEVGDRLRSVANGKEAAPRIYQERFNDPFTFPSGRTAPAFKELGMQSHLNTTMARYSDLLQLADFVAGTVAEWTDAYLSENDIFVSRTVRDFRDDNVQRLLPIANRYRGTAWQYGVMVFPDAWQSWGMRDRLNALDAALTSRAN